MLKNTLSVTFASFVSFCAFVLEEADALPIHHLRREDNHEIQGASIDFTLTDDTVTFLDNYIANFMDENIEAYIDTYFEDGNVNFIPVLMGGSDDHEPAESQNNKNKLKARSNNVVVGSPAVPPAHAMAEDSDNNDPGFFESVISQINKILGCPKIPAPAAPTSFPHAGEILKENFDSLIACFQEKYDNSKNEKEKEKDEEKKKRVESKIKRAFVTTVTVPRHVETVPAHILTAPSTILAKTPTVWPTPQVGTPLVRTAPPPSSSVVTPTPRVVNPSSPANNEAGFDLRELYAEVLASISVPVSAIPGTILIDPATHTKHTSKSREPYSTAVKHTKIGTDPGVAPTIVATILPGVIHTGPIVSGSKGVLAAAAPSGTNVPVAVPVSHTAGAAHKAHEAAVAAHTKPHDLPAGLQTETKVPVPAASHTGGAHNIAVSIATAPAVPVSSHTKVPVVAGTATPGPVAAI